MHKKDTIADILSAPDRDELINWLRNQPLLIEQGDVLFAHAGIHPLWDLPTAQKLAQEAHEALAGPQWQRWLQGMYGNTQWSMLGLINRPNLVAIDTGCLWGGELTAVRFPDRRIFQEKCPCWANPLAFSKKHKKD